LRKAEVISDLERTTPSEEVSWKQKLRILWLREGHKNTKLLHQLANSNRHNNSFKSLDINGTVSFDVIEIREHILRFYNRFYSEQFSWQPNLHSVHFDSICNEEASWMERAFEKSENFAVVEAMNDDNWGHDGFSLAFFQTCWEVLK
jgi:hypothetical protein